MRGLWLGFELGIEFGIWLGSGIWLELD